MESCAKFHGTPVSRRFIRQSLTSKVHLLKSVPAYTSCVFWSLSYFLSRLPVDLGIATWFVRTAGKLLQQKGVDAAEYQHTSSCRMVANVSKEYLPQVRASRFT